ncbi:hypothetical protein HNQ51_000707 [Inhella inkyongensis]|uniref:Nucleotidyltransferase family protein n=1 Tax=Inhella inkyongensis TaxID=392593 RepID=A0A840S3K6_9BURK|nr:nucleotidyltransferase family protein [Inhella inkyongensis]MBB5203414.1 hypothetical protein [Inhella inkyongensis]
MQRRFVDDVLCNRHNRAILDAWPVLDLPDAWLVAGCLFQTIWNLQAGRRPESDIKDYDLFYFDAADLSESGEQAIQERVQALFARDGIQVEAKNQARVHLWYARRFGPVYPALSSAAEGIDRFLMPATSVGLRPCARKTQGLQIHAPYGLDDLYAGRLRLNPLTPHAELYRAKARSYQARWPSLSIEEPMAAA